MYFLGIIITPLPKKGKLPKILPDFKQINENVAFALTLAKTGFNTSPLPSEMNYTKHMLTPEENPTKLKPMLIHHHHQIFEDGALMPSPHKSINKVIDQINEFLKKEKKLEVSSSNILPFITHKLLEKGNNSEVIKRLNDLPIDHDNSVLHFQLAKAYEKTENYTGSLNRYSASLKNGFDPIGIYLNRGSVFLKAGQLINAKNDFQKAFELNPAEEWQVKELSILEKSISWHENREKLKKKS